MYVYIVSELNSPYFKFGLSKRDDGNRIMSYATAYTKFDSHIIPCNNPEEVERAVRDRLSSILLEHPSGRKSERAPRGENNVNLHTALAVMLETRTLSRVQSYSEPTLGDDVNQDVENAKLVLETAINSAEIAKANTASCDAICHAIKAGAEAREATTELAIEKARQALEEAENPPPQADPILSTDDEEEPPLDGIYSTEEVEEVAEEVDGTLDPLAILVESAKETPSPYRIAKLVAHVLDGKLSFSTTAKRWYMDGCFVEDNRALLMVEEAVDPFDQRIASAINRNNNLFKVGQKLQVLLANANLHETIDDYKDHPLYEWLARHVRVTNNKKDVLRRDDVVDKYMKEVNEDVFPKKQVARFSEMYMRRFSIKYNKEGGKVNISSKKRLSVRHFAIGLVLVSPTGDST